MEAPTKVEAPTQHQVPEWETQGAPQQSKSISDRFHNLLPPHKRYIGLRRRTFLIFLLFVLFALIGLIIGLAVGLTVGRKSGTQNLPLPTNDQNFTGDLTYYGVGLGACGITYSDNDEVVSISHFVFDAEQGGASDPNSNPLCGRMIRAERYYSEIGERRSVDLKVGDRCVGCQPTDLDTSTAVFSKLAPIASGRVDVTWAWLGPEPTAS
ncbi:hypothetical protein EV356DRAFT_530465 [Viridothelium virens]|uniref:RlpA-like protein double-psi beta-barrel domain-containing protein n=1 Tax=Viridothelium virens TaxID=1048519 RepID=A0A6A6HHD3_VIRVR|nr:hypothetical protein EV356DRAFT_530465 [Viridothelium virens]